MKRPRALQLTAALLLLAVPVGLAWSLAARRSWLPRTRPFGQGSVQEVRFSPDGQSLTVVGWEQSNVLRADALHPDTLRPIKPLARFTVPLMQISFAPQLGSPVPGTPTPPPLGTVALKTPTAFFRTMPSSRPTGASLEI